MSDLLERLDRAAMWSRPHLTSEQAGAVVADLLDRGEDTSQRVAREAQGPVLDAVREADWPGVTGADLVVMGEGYFHVHRGRDTFLPESNRPNDPTARWVIFIHGLWMAAERASVPPEPVVVNAVLTALAGIPALEEVDRRWQQHVGADAAVWMLLANWPFEDRIDDWELTMTPKLVQSVVRYAELDRHAFMNARLRPGLATLKDAKDAAPGQLATYLLRRYGTAHPMELLATALDGGLNLATVSAGDELFRHLLGGRPEKDEHRRKTDVTFEFKEAEDLGRYEPRSHDAPIEDALDTRDRLRRARDVDPTTFDALVSADGDVSAAADILGVTRQTVYNRMKKMKKGD